MSKITQLSEFEKLVESYKECLEVCMCSEFNKESMADDPEYAEMVSKEHAKEEEAKAALLAYVAKVEKQLNLVLQLGTRFGFTTEQSSGQWSVGQVVTHAEYLQSERARLLYETVTLQQQLAAKDEQIRHLMTTDEHIRRLEPCACVCHTKHGQHLEADLAAAREALRKQQAAAKNLWKIDWALSAIARAEHINFAQGYAEQAEGTLREIRAALNCESGGTQ